MADVLTAARAAFVDLYGEMPTAIDERATYIVQMEVFIIGFEAGVRVAQAREEDHVHRA